MARGLNDLPVGLRVSGLAVAHGLLFALIYAFAFALRFDFTLPAQVRDVFWSSVGWVWPLKVLAFYLAGHYHGWWRHVTFADLLTLLRAAVLALLLMAAADRFLCDGQIPRTVLILDALLTIVILGVMRGAWRVMRLQFAWLWPVQNYRPALLVGPDLSAGLLAHQIHTHPESKYRIQGILNTKGNGRGSRLGGIPILGVPGQLRPIAAALHITDVLFIAGSTSGKQLRQLMRSCEAGRLLLKIIPPVEDLFDGGRHVPVRDIEINDLLRREPVALDGQAIGQLLEGRRVLVTGAGGSIGAEICRQVLKFPPRQLLLLGRGENRIFFLDRELRALHIAAEILPRIGDVTDKARLATLFAEFRPDIVFHAAAHKHVPLMEDNPGEALKNNVLGTRNVVDLACEFHTGRFVLVSTDKAVHPTSVMGASKQLAERYVMARSRQSATRFMATRFGNVLGSAGSVVPIFREQIRNGGPITITDPRMTRFFMTIPEASGLVLQAAAMGRGGEIFVLDMGEPVHIVDLARDMIRLSGLPADAIEITYNGVRPGEKLYEELYFEDEQTVPTAHPKLRMAYHRPFDLAEVSAAIDELLACSNAPPNTIRAKLQQILAEYQPAEIGPPSGGADSSAGSAVRKIQRVSREKDHQPAATAGS